MKKIQAILSKNANYIFHMLSVSKAGYDNEYGNQYKKHHNKYQLATLNKYKRYITVRGGEHCGKLFGILVSYPASIQDSFSVSNYYKAMLDIFSSHNHQKNKELYNEIFLLNKNGKIYNMKYDNFYYGFKPLSTVICDICNVMIINYNIYMNKIWAKEKKIIDYAVNKSNEYFNSKDYIGLWEKTTGYDYAYSHFYTILCNSICNGPQAIDISFNKDVFYIPTDFNYFSQFVSHEIGIYILLNQLQDILGNNFLKYWSLFESLAGFFNGIVINEPIICWSGESKYKSFYSHLYNEQNNITPKEMFQKAINEFIENGEEV